MSGTHALLRYWECTHDWCSKEWLSWTLMIPLRLLHCKTKQGITGGVQGNPVMKTGLSCNHYRVSLHAPCSTLFGIAVYMFQFSFSGYNIKVRHELLSGAIGTFEEENTAYLLVSWLLWVLPMTVTIAALMDAILVYGYMKWAHPWAGILGTKFVVPFSSLSSSLKSSTFLREKGIITWMKALPYFPLMIFFFTQYLCKQKRGVIWWIFMTTWEQKNERKK